MKLSDIYIYPLKSCTAQEVSPTRILPTGIPFDRSILAINERNQTLTGRECQRLTLISAKINGNSLHLSIEENNPLIIDLPSDEQRLMEFKLFRNKVQGLLFDKKASDWISDVLGMNLRLVYIKEHYRPITPKRGGTNNERMAYADASPIHVILKESVASLGTELNHDINPMRFRPNLIISGGKPFEEDHWETVRIGNSEFRVQQKCERCIFTTIDPITSVKDDAMEPLATLAGFRKRRNEGLTFGIYLVPLNEGLIKVGDTVQITTSNQ